jgi:hypothetical protein
VDHGIGWDRRRELGRRAIDEDIDVQPEPWPGFHEPIAQARHADVEGLDDGRDRLAVDLMASFDAGKERDQRAGQYDGRHAGGSALAVEHGGFDRPDLRERVGDHSPRHALVDALPELPGARPKGDPDWIERVASHRLAQHGQERISGR